MTRLAALLPLALAGGLLAFPAAAEVDPASLGEEHFIGHWSLDGPEGCESRDTMSFYASGAWAVTNGGGNPVEAIGVWSLVEGGIALSHGGLSRTGDFESGTIVVVTAEAGRMEIAFEVDGGSQGFTLDRCD